ncbi:hypothetical protein T440DRAFT_517771 [Plenodomus tracheiphilus IPT5]|uniref:Uncharacterized protein n=1 Tax=Plenodomus tracheiphilus IPT5 TaxID=1408161 RepID=A0A6A7B7W1_9PLEO|nr:hypothetical protein T440DRAFT_517771 [Plenodomus tracheiphilus IPT5]
MPRNGDGSSDNGPIEGHEIVHGTSGDKSLQHTKHVAPVPDVEAGDSLPGMGAGGVADVVQGDSEEFGTNEPKKDPLDDSNDGNDTTMPDRDSTRDSPSSRPTGPKRQKTGDVAVSGLQTESSSFSGSRSKSNNSSGASKASAGSSDPNDLEQISRHKAEKYVALDEDEVAISSAGTEAEKREARADRRADALGEEKDKGKAEKEGGHADVEALHGEADSRGPGRGGKTSGGDGSSTGTGARKGGNGNDKSDSGGDDEGNDLEKVQRHQAEKYGAVNLEKE